MLNFHYELWTSCLVVLTKTWITPVNGNSLSDFRRSLSAIAIMSKLTCHYPLNCCTFLSSGPAIAKRKHRFFEPKKPLSPFLPSLFGEGSGERLPFSPRGDREGVSSYIINHPPKLGDWSHKKKKTEADFRLLVIVLGEQIKDCRLSSLTSLTIA
jgi:hypothetical protein